MASRKEPQSHEPINLDECFQVLPEDVTRAEPIVTGLSDEEDVGRHLALRFSPTLLFCPNCEIVVDHECDWLLQPEVATVIFFCPRCNARLAPMGTPPTPTRRKHT